MAGSVAELRFETTGAHGDGPSITSSGRGRVRDEVELGRLRHPRLETFEATRQPAPAGL